MEKPNRLTRESRQASLDLSRKYHGHSTFNPDSEWRSTVRLPIFGRCAKKNETPKRVYPDCLGFDLALDASCSDLLCFLDFLNRLVDRSILPSITDLNFGMGA